MMTESGCSPEKAMLLRSEGSPLSTNLEPRRLQVASVPFECLQSSGTQRPGETLTECHEELSHLACVHCPTEPTSSIDRPSSSEHLAVCAGPPHEVTRACKGRWDNQNLKVMMSSTFQWPEGLERGEMRCQICHLSSRYFRSSADEARQGSFTKRAVIEHSVQLPEAISQRTLSISRVVVPC